MNQIRARACRCEGWWEQGFYGRQPMTNLQITFEQGRFQGSGTDIVGPFTLSGIISDGGVVTIDKQYVGRHCVQYSGNYDGEGTMAGTWTVEGFHGPWLIRIRRYESENIADIREIVPT